MENKNPINSLIAETSLKCWTQIVFKWHVFRYISSYYIPYTIFNKKKRILAFVSHLVVVHGAMGCREKNLQYVWRCHQLLSGFLAKGHSPRVSRQSRRSPMIRAIMKWSWGLCADLLAFALQPRKTLKTSARRPSEEGTVRPVIASNGVPYPQMRSVGSHSTWGREKEVSSS